MASEGCVSEAGDDAFFDDLAFMKAGKERANVEKQMPSPKAEQKKMENI